MANDVTIEVEARVGDALASLTLTAAAVRALGDEAAGASAEIGDERDGRTLSGRLGGLRRTLSNIGDRGPLGSIVRGFGNLASAMLAPIDLGFQFAENFERMGSVAQAFIGIGASLGIGLVGLAAAIGVAVLAATALADILGTLIAIAADFVAPVTLLTGLLGGLAAGFVIGAKRAAEGGVHLNAFSDIVDKLGSMFQRTSTILAQRFLPYLVELGHAAVQALTFLDKIIKLPLGQAFRAIDTQGTKMLGQFVDRVAEVLSKPIRLAFHVAFEDTAFSAMVSDWWHRFTGFLFGETRMKPIVLPDGTVRLRPHQVDGVFQPLIDWFNRHTFTKQGIVIGRQILAGVLNSGMRRRVAQFMLDVFKDAAKTAGRAVIQLLGQALVWVGHKAASIARGIPGDIRQAVSTGKNLIISMLGSAWDWVKQKVNGVWDWVVQKVESVMNISINWPSPPSWFTDLLGGAGGLAKRIGSGVPGVGSVAGMGGAGVVSPARGSRGASGIGGFANVTVMAGPLDSYSARRNTAAMLSRELERRWKRSGR